jgi:hypothetical protein
MNSFGLRRPKATAPHSLVAHDGGLAESATWAGYLSQLRATRRPNWPSDTASAQRALGLATVPWAVAVAWLTAACRCMPPRPIFIAIMGIDGGARLARC